jgi:hypothetical protein
MKSLFSSSILVAILLCMSSMCYGQIGENCDELRSKIEVLKKKETELNTPSLQRVVKESRLKLYAQYRRCLEQDISAASSVRDTVTGTDAAVVIEEKLKQLIREKRDTDKEIASLSLELNLPETRESSVGALNGTPGDGERAAVLSKTPTRHSKPAPTDTTTSPIPPPSCEPGKAYDDAPELLTDIVGKAAHDVVQKKDGNALSAGVPQMLLYTIMDAASPASSRRIRGMKAYQYLSETARTDKQLGASAKSDGAVSAIEKPGFARLLGLAVEHGGIDKKNDGTTLTLSTSLYSLYKMNKEDTAETYARAGALNRIGVSASFGISDKNNELANARRNNLSEWGVKARLFGDRSTRSAQFQRFWDKEIRPLINDRLRALGGGIEHLSNDIEGYDLMESSLTDCLEAAVKDRMDDADYETATPEGQEKILTSLIIAHLKANVFNRVQNGQLELSDKVKRDIELEYLPKLKTALDNLVTAGGLIDKKLEDLKKAPLGTFAYTNHRIPTGSDYSETKFLFEQDKGSFGPLKLTGNFGLSFYNKPSPTLNQQRLRDITAALSFEGTSNSPFTENDNQSKITYSFVGRYERLFENRNRVGRKPDIRVLQFVTEIPLVKGFSWPLSISYANATEEERKQGFRFNFGMRLDTDKLFELLGKPKP